MSRQQIPPAKAIDIYTRVARIRKFEEQVAKLFSQGQLPGFVHLYIGEEAVAAGVCAALRDDDYIVSTHRGHGHVIAKGGDFDRMMAELFGRADGYCKGKGGSMHIADFEIGMLGACGIVGGGIPIATGAGLSAFYRGTDQVSVSFFGDGASNEGSFHESLNLASTWKLPVIFVCENNRYGEFTPMEKATNVVDIAERAKAYGIPGVVADGTDPLAMYEIATEAVARARRGEGPTLVEAKTYRIGDHAEGESAFLAGQTYRPEAERKAARDADPMTGMRRTLIELGFASEAEIASIDAGIADAVERSVAFARQSPTPGLETIYDDRWA